MLRLIDDILAVFGRVFYWFAVICLIVYLVVSLLTAFGVIY